MVARFPPIPWSRSTAPPPRRPGANQARMTLPERLAKLTEVAPSLAGGCSTMLRAGRARTQPPAPIRNITAVTRRIVFGVLLGGFIERLTRHEPFRARRG